MKLQCLSTMLITTVATSVLVTTEAQAQDKSHTDKIQTPIKFKEVDEPSLTIHFKDNSHPETNQYLANFFKVFIASNKNNLKTLLASGFVQKVGDKENNYNAFIKHASFLSNQLKSMDIVFEDVNIDSDGTISDIHTVTASKLDGTSAIFKLYAFYYFDKKEKLTKIDESSVLLHGSKADSDLGSQTS
ncbi:hypothetical protein UB33_08700 [Photobacterium angustum]|uniref:hypothetical protein n=1 Tax=Photobacterium angustum TaxID=661 RepID=UPI0005E98520|nr:hypothetical protein [Photobacterium angustum]KJF96175.1 hypothetical protein UB39_02215 [Photobacterium angustum]KJG06627.1 hypothetical protein UB33_08700 [Photobacterium angustum]PSV91639.1 hypothetical protein CTN01_13860 [Photobacterium angustum]PSW82392.1 hypothetical protein CTN03_04270 [Photobacterium angustum]